MFNAKWKAKGDEGEAALREWLDRNGFGYVAVCQAKETFARLFVGELKRPDFLVLVDSVGILAVDAKNRELLSDGYYPLDYEKELKRAIMFERIFRLPIWYAYQGKERDQWNWISALKAFEVGEKCGDGPTSFLKISPDEFACVNTGADFGKLYTHRMPGFGKLRAGTEWE
jgi:hypothetical protein